MKNKVSIIIGLIVVGFLLTMRVDKVSAFSASITTSSSVSIDASLAGNGSSIHEESINIQSDCRSGYNLTIATPNGSDLYIDGDSTKSASFTAVDGASALNSSSNNNKWGYTLSSNASSSTVFSPLSSQESMLKSSAETANPNSDINDTFSIYYGVKTDNTVTPGSYQMANNGAVVYYLIMNTICSQYTVSFNANGGVGTINSQNLQVGEPTELPSADVLTAPTGASYTDSGNNIVTGNPDKLWTFWGWNTAIDGTGDWYRDREAVEDLANAGNTITLYAQWKQATLADLVPGTQIGAEKVIDHNLMQDMKPEVCWNSTAYDASTSSPAHNPYNASSNPNGYHTVVLLDHRGKVTTGENPEAPEQYTVSKLPDGLCWMTENLRLGRESGGPNGDGTVTLTSRDSDITASSYRLPASSTAFETSNNSYSTPKMLIDSTYGYYYSFSAATAGMGSGYYMDTSVTTSICPKNWDLPTKYQYDNLKVKANLNNYSTAHAAPYGFTYGGYRNGASFSSRSNSIRMWTSTHYSSNIAYYSTSYSLAAYSSNYKRYGEFVRCVAGQGNANIHYEGNGGDSGSGDNQINVEIGNERARSSSGYIKDGWYFDKWNTKPDGTGTVVSKNEAFTGMGLKPGDSLTLYAQWLPQYKINYVNNCQTYISDNPNCTQEVSVNTEERAFNIDVNGNGSTTLMNYNNGDTWNIAGWKIAGWSVVSNNTSGSNVEYRSSDNYSVTGVSTSAPIEITLYAHWVPTYTIQYDGNGADNSDTGMGIIDAETGIKSVAHTNVGEGDTFDLFAPNFKKTGHGFVGWSTDADAWNKLTDNDPDNDVRIWGPNEMMTAPSYNGTSITTLYAVWASAEKDINDDPVYLQGWNGCPLMTATTYDSTTGALTVAKNSITALTDERDGEIYTIAKLADENCWMIENLRLSDAHEEDGNIVATILSTSNTNIDSSNSSLPITNVYSTSVTSNSLSPSSSVIYDASSAPYGWCTSSNAPCINQSRLNTNNTVSNVTPSQAQSIGFIDAHENLNDAIYSYGNYYNWYSATAGYGTTASVAYKPTTGDICPAGWKLPYGNTGTSGNNIGGTKGGFYYLASRMNTTSNDKAGSKIIRMFPNNFVYSGSWYGGSAGSRGSAGWYWSASSGGEGSAFGLGLNISGFYPGNVSSYTKFTGHAVRCISNS